MSSQKTKVRKSQERQGTPKTKTRSTESRIKTKTPNSKDPVRSSRRRNLKKEHKKEDVEGFEVVDFTIKHFKITNWDTFKGITYTVKELHNLLDLAIAAIQKDAQVVKISAPVTIVGDLNGSFPDLIRVFNVKSTACSSEIKYAFVGEKYVFLGDYTEFDDYNLETICLLFALKVVFEKRYVLLRGHQETYANTRFRDQIYTKYANNAAALWKKFERAFCLLPLAAIVGEKILCVHAGISPLLRNSILKLEDIPKCTEIDKCPPVVKDILFSSPLEDDVKGAEKKDPLYVASDRRDQIKKFNEAAIERFCSSTNIKLIVRSHDVPPNGFQFFCDQKLVTIFTTPMFNGYNNKGAILKVTRSGIVAVVQFRTPVGAIERAKSKPRENRDLDVDMNNDSLFDNLSDRPR